MERPTDVKVGPWVYKIEWSTEEEWRADDEPRQFGAISKHEELQIRMMVTETRSEGSLRETLLHEIFHCVFTVVGLNHYTRPRRGDIDEYIITSATPTFLAVLVENPRVMRYLLGEE